MTDQPLDLAGIGIGPFNLSIAALLDGQRSVNALFLDNKSTFSWHPGMQLPGSRLQTSCLKDLVTGVDPCNPHSFLNYLVQHGRFYDFLSANMPAISRAEYADYLGWVAARLGNLRFDSPVESVHFNGDHFELQVTGRQTPLQSRNLCIGTGITPQVPPACSKVFPQHRDHAPPTRPVRREGDGCRRWPVRRRDSTGTYGRHLGRAREYYLDLPKAQLRAAG